MRIPEWLRNCTNEQFIEMLRNLPRPNFQKVGNEGNSDLRGLPRFVEAFDEICEKLGRLPNQSEYADYYIDKAADFLEEHKLDKKAFRKRAARNHPSFLREYQLYFFIKEKFPRSEVALDAEWDSQGVDIVITAPDGRRMGICSFTGTGFGAYRSSYKNRTSRKKIDFPLMELPITSDTAYIVNGYWTYGENHYKEIALFMIKTFGKKAK